MKCQCVGILVFAFVIHLTNAAPPFDIDLFLDELLEMNIRMGDIILRAKYECKQLTDDEWKGITQFGDNDNQLENPSVQKNVETGDDKIKKTERSFIGSAFDLTGNQWNDRYDREEITESEGKNSQSQEKNSQNEEEILQDNTIIGAESESDENVNDDVAVAVDNNNCDHEQPIDDESVNDDGFSDQNYLGESTDNQTTESANIEPVCSEAPYNNEESETEATGEEQYIEETQNSEEPQSAESLENTGTTELGNDPYDTFYYDPLYDLEPSNNENDKGWFGTVIDKFTSFFS